MENPENFINYLVGFLIITNLGLVATGVYTLMKVSWYFSRQDLRLEMVEKAIAKEEGAKETAVRAHMRLTDMGAPR